ncbi:Fatty acyl-CoA reductase 2, chloroplastic [Linum grandiflorum]
MFTNDAMNTMAAGNSSLGLGIEDFLSGKTWLITGATGFLGKVLVEKILRSIPDTSKIYLLIKAEDNEAAFRRLQTEIIEADVFRVLKERHGELFENFVLNKLVPVVGDITRTDLGFKCGLVADLIADEVDVIVNSAANTAFDDRYDTSNDTNTRGAINLVRFAGKCNNLKGFLHVSTVYANGGRRGTVMEKPFRNGDTTLVETHLVSGGSNTASSVNDTFLRPLTILDVGSEIELALDCATYASSTDLDLILLGTERAQTFGWHDTYTFTKAMGEMLIGEYVQRSNLKVPVVILRPSIIESTYADPFSGWIEGNRMIDPVAQAYGKGLLTSIPGDPISIIDVIPVDMVVNAALAAITRHATSIPAIPTVNVYQIGSSVSNPVTLSQIATFFYRHFESSPILNDNGSPIGVSKPLDFCSWDRYCSDIYRRLSSPKLCRRLIRLGRLYQPYTCFMGRYDCSNTEELAEEMSEDERMKFGFDVRKIDWKHYFVELHLPGFRKHVMKEKILPPAEDM